jgi:hypothetical protein
MVEKTRRETQYKKGKKKNLSERTKTMKESSGFLLEMTSQPPGIDL